MRVKQTARKSTASRGSQGGPSPTIPRIRISVGNQNSSISRPDKPKSEDPVRARLSSLLRTKRESYGDQEGPSSAPRHGKRSNAVKIRPRSKHGEQALREIQRLQRGYDLLIPRYSFHRVVREVTMDILKSRPDAEQNVRYQAAALEALQEAAEGYLVRLFEDSYLCTRHAGRVTLFAKDMHLTRRLQHGM